MAEDREVTAEWRCCKVYMQKSQEVWKCPVSAVLGSQQPGPLQPWDQLELENSLSPDSLRADR